MVSIQLVKCPACGYEWPPRVPNPKRCPNPRCGKPYPLGNPPGENHKGEGDALGKD
jgi:hypothetical protein